MRLFITGGTGFIGRNIIEQLSFKHDILAPRHNELELLDTEAVDNFFKVHDVEVVVHCAVKPGHRNAKDLTNLLYADLLMFYNLARNAYRYRKMIYISTGAVYDTRFPMHKVAEQYFGRHIPIDEHGLFRYAASKYVESGADIVEIRPFSIFGKYEDYAIRFISNAICKTLFDLPITIRQNRGLDFIFIDDLVGIIDYFVVNDAKHKFYNATPDEAIELKTVAEKVLAISGKDLPIRIGKSGMGTEYSGSNLRLRDEMGSLRLTPIDEAIRSLYGWYREHKSELNGKLLLFDK